MCNCNKNIKVKNIAETITKGVVGLTKVAVGIDLADQTTIENRRNVCRECEYATKNKSRLRLPTKGLTSFSRCLKCSCVIAAKTKLKTEVCPLNKW